MITRHHSNQNVASFSFCIMKKRKLMKVLRFHITRQVVLISMEEINEKLHRLLWIVECYSNKEDRQFYRYNRNVLYVTNLSKETTSRHLYARFSTVGQVKSVRLPKRFVMGIGPRSFVKRYPAGFAYIEMRTVENLYNALELNNAILNGRSLKLQISHCGQENSANEKNISGRKILKLDDIRNLVEHSTKDGKKKKNKALGLRNSYQRCLKCSLAYLIRREMSAQQPSPLAPPSSPEHYFSSVPRTSGQSSENH